MIDNNEKQYIQENTKLEYNLTYEISQQSHQKKINFDYLNVSQVYGYGVGHFFNDLCGAAWFNYLVYFLKTVIQLTFVPYIMLVGQVADAIATPLVGYLSDKTETKFGKRTPWYVVGSVVVLGTFLPTWHDIGNNETWYVYFYYITFPAFLNIGWAAVQIAHMSLVPSLTCSRKRRDKLNSLRNTFTFLANLVVLIAALILFQFESNSILDFEYLSYIIASLGIPASIFFLFQIREVPLTQQCSKITSQLLIEVNQLKLKKQAYLKNKVLNNSYTDNQVQIDEQKGQLNVDLIQDEVDKDEQKEGEGQKTNWKQWFKEVMFYQYGIAYMGVRLYCNIFSTLMNYYIIVVLQYSADPNDVKSTPIQVAIIPLILYVSSVIASMMLQYLYKLFGRKITFSIGGILMVASSVSLALLTVDLRELIYVIAFIVGIAQALTLNTGLTMISEVIGIRGQSGAFVFGAYSFLDKISSGIALFIITNQPNSVFYSEGFIRWCIVLIPGVACSLSWVIIMIGKARDYNVQKNNNQTLSKEKNKLLVRSSFQSHSSFIDEFAA